MEVTTDAIVSSAGSATSAALTKFTKFNKLPIELRLKIWDYHLTSTTILKIYGHIIKRKSGKHRSLVFTDHQGWASDVESICRKTRVPPLLCVCHESREVFKNKFPFSIPFRACGCACTNNGAGGKLRFSAKDTIFIQNLGHLWHLTQFPGLLDAQVWPEEVKLLGIDPEFIRAHNWRMIFSLFRNLTKVTAMPCQEWVMHRRSCPTCKSDHDQSVSGARQAIEELREEGYHTADFELNDDI
ncbi:uncharacterized protein PAC_11623 [Phialocephala subalpina]|uniref:2EXR domain-containing protein n=1 Tax=Phialocephala subalpina TaxID=576137 RepID=A0A1L7X9Q9_9HELO|nr:uncharacterized protein PAC_11623 [Phialocephala subalpina]